MNKEYVVRLTEEQRRQLEELVRKGKTAAYRIRHANILLKVDANGAGWSDQATAQAFGCHLNTVVNVRRRFVERGLEGALIRKKQDAPSHKPLLDGEKEAHLIALACSAPPDGRTRWTLKLLAGRLVELEVVESVSDQTVRRVLKKTPCSPIATSVGAFPRRKTASSLPAWRTSSRSTAALMTGASPSSAWTNNRAN